MKSVLILIIILSIYMPYHFAQGSDNEELNSMTKAAKQNGYTIREWNVYQKSSIGKVKNEKEYNLFINQIKKDLKGYKWESTKEINHHFKLVGLKTDSKYRLSQRLVITAIKGKDGYDLERTHEITGQIWNEEVSDKVLSEAFDNSNQPQTFYNVRADMLMNKPNQDKLKSKSQKLVSDLSAKEVEGLTEGNFVSYSALSKKWNYSLKLKNNNKMNLQVANRFTEDDNKLTVTIGTPIIIKEY